jgi:outer membrane protein
MRLLSLALGVAMLAAPAYAQTEDLLQRLVETSPDIAAAEEEAAAFRAEVWEARGRALPQLSMQAQAGTIDETFRINGVPGELSAIRDPAAAIASVEQALFTSGRIGGTIGAAKAQAEQAEHSADAVRQDVILQGAIAIADLVRDRAIQAERRENKRVVRGRREESEARRTAGLATSTDVEQSRARLALAEAQRISAEGGTARSEAAFERVFGFPAPDDLRLPEASRALPGNLDTAIQAAVASSPDLGASKDAQRAARHAVRAERGRVLPQVSLNASAAYIENERFGIELGEAEQYQVTVQGRWNLFSGGSGYARTRAASKRARAARSRTHSVERLIRQQTIAAWADLVASRSVVTARRAQVEAARLAADGVAAEFRSGRRTRLDVLDADRERTDAEVGLITARADLATAEFKLLRVIGAL